MEREGEEEGCPLATYYFISAKKKILGRRNAKGLAVFTESKRETMTERNHVNIEINSVLSSTGPELESRRDSILG